MERSIHDEFIARMIAEVKKMKVEDPLDRSTAHGPQNHKYIFQLYTRASHITMVIFFLVGVTWRSCWSTVRLEWIRGPLLSMEARELIDQVDHAT